MAKSVVINLDINTKDSVKDIGQLNNELELTLDTLGDMRKASAALEEELEKTQVGTKQYKELRKELIKVNTEIKNQELAMEALDNEQVASELKSVAGGFVDIAGGMALVGAGNESLEKVVQTMAQVEGATKIVTGAMEAYSSMMKLSNTITGVFSKAIAFLGKQQIILAAKTKIVSAATAVWNAILALNPIVLIVAGVAALIAGIVLLIVNIKKVIKWFGDWKNAVLALLGPIGWAIIAYRKLQDVRDENFKKNVDQAAKIAQSVQTQILLIKKQAEEEKKAHDLRVTNYQLEIEALEAVGESSTEVRREMLKENIEYTKSVLESNKLIRKSFDSAFKEIKNQSGLFADAAKILREDRAKQEESDRVAYERAEIALTKFEHDEQKKRVDAARKASEDKAKAEEDYIRRSTAAYEKIDQIEIDMMEDSLKKRELIRQREFDNRIKDLDANIDAEAKLIKKEEEFLQQDLSKIRRDWYSSQEEPERMKMIKKTNEKRLKEEQSHQEKVKKTRLQIWLETGQQWQTKWQEMNAQTIARIQESFQVASDAINGVIGLIQEGLNEQAQEASSQRESRYSAEQEALKASLANRELTQKQFETKMALLEQKKATEERAAARKAFQMDKAFRITQAVMGTAQAVISGLSAPFPLGIIQASINAALGAAQIGVIASQKFRAAKGGVVPGSPSNVDSVDALLAPGEMVINSTSAQMFPQTLSAINQAGGGISLAPDVAPQSKPVYKENESSQRVYVLETDITDTQKKVSRVEQSASFG